MPRVVQIHNAHPRLKLDRRLVTRAIHTLDAQFRTTAADLPQLTPAARRRAREQLASAATTTTAVRQPASPSPSSVPDGELSLAFLTDAALAQLHDDFLADPTTTDVITFEGDPAFGSAGEICVSADTAAAFAKANQRDFSDELTLYVVHGWLHLAGYDDLKPRKKRRMRAAESRAMQLLRDAGSLPRFALKTK